MTVNIKDIQKALIKKNLNEALNMKEIERFETQLERHIGNHIIEGIDVVRDEEKKTGQVFYNPKHDEGVNTDENDNPRKYKVDKIHNIDPNIEVWSIFKRVKSSDPKMNDGMPLLLAMKDIAWKGFKWTIDEENLNKIYGQVDKIVKRLNKARKFDVAITTPTTNHLNQTILHRVNHLLNLPDKIVTPITKIKNSEAEAFIEGEKNKIPPEDYKDIMYIFKTKIYYDDPEADISQDDLKRFPFQIKYINPPRLRAYFTKMYELNPTDAENIKMAERVNGKDILVIDDTITSGSSLSQYVDFIKIHFTPKSITVLTLFSPLENR